MPIVTLDLLSMLDNKYKCDEILKSGLDCRLLLNHSKSYVY